MNLAEYARLDATALAALIARGELSAREAARTAAAAIDAIDPQVNAVVERYDDRIDALDERTLGPGPFRGVPCLIKDVFGHEAGRLIEFGSRLCRGMTVPADTHFAELMRAAGINLIGRSNAPEYSMAGTAENALYGNTSTPWRHGYSAGGSTGGGMAAVVAGMVPIAHGTDIAGSIRIPAAMCGGVGLKPSRGRLSFGPAIDENGWGLATHLMQTKSVRDAAALLDALAVPQPGDPFPIPRPAEPWAALARRAPPRLRIALTVAPLMGVPVDPGVEAAVRDTARLLERHGHAVEEVDPRAAVPDGLAMLRQMMDVWFFGLDARLQGYAARTGQAIGPHTLEPVVLRFYEEAPRITPARFIASVNALNAYRRALARVLAPFDLWLTPTTARTAEPWGTYSLSRTDLDYEQVAPAIYAPLFQFTLPHNVMGTPAISLPLALHDNGLPIGVQLGAHPAREDVVLQIAALLEAERPWAARVPPLHVSRV